MSQSGYTPIQIYRTTTAAATPSAGNLVAGELAINLTDEKLYFKNAGGTVKLLASSAGAEGTVTSVDVSGGTTGLTTSGGPITSSGTITLGGTLGVANGGTGQSSYTVGDLLYASGSTALSKLADVATGNALISGGVGVAPAWGKIGLTTHVSGTLPVANGGTGATSLTSGYLVKGNGTSAVTASVVYDDGTNVGIGTSSPGAKLDVLGASSDQIRVRTASAEYYRFGRNSSTGYMDFYGSQTGYTGYTFGGVDGERMRIDSSGNVGIGTSSPGAVLDVKSQINVTNPANNSMNAVRGSNFGYSSSYNAMVVGAVSGNTTVCIAVDPVANAGSAFDGTGGEVMFRNGVEFITPNSGNTSYHNNVLVMKDGDVGMGTSSPVNTTVASGSVTANGVLAVKNYLSSNQSDVGIIEYNGGKMSLRPYGATAGTGYLTFTTGGGGGSSDSERMRIDSSGNVLINRTSASGLGKLNCEGGADFTSGNVYLARDTGNVMVGTTTASGKFTSVTATSSQAAVFCVGLTDARLSQTTQASGTSYFDYFLYNATTVGSITSTGTTTAYNTSSDVRLKENIVDAASASDAIDALQVRQFDWKSTGEHTSFGMVAQELEVVAPEAVTKGRNEEDMWGVDYSKLVPMLVKEIQSLRARVAQLEGN